ncbi:hypothetical protein EYF80_017255 [Liparis tanakae]|uniref:Uncharacterized protein n=1 Tax=Liparis tanakae TaxID=230148 RepID=A0A4Z2I342_9TELE|nr:hypothetical protein EYF80_017255 [Liparis tanakae]
MPRGASGLLGAQRNTVSSRGRRRAWATDLEEEEEERMTHLSSSVLSLIRSSKLEEYCSNMHSIESMIVNALGDQNSIEPVICHFQYKAPVYHTVAGFEPSVDDVTIVQILHAAPGAVFGHNGKDPRVVEQSQEQIEVLVPHVSELIGRQ